VTLIRKESKMTREEVLFRVKSVFHDAFDRDVELDDTTSSADVEGWDSFAHVTLIGLLEDEFGIKFPMNEVFGMTNVGAIVTRICELAD